MSPLSGFLAVIVFFTAILVAYLTKQFQKETLKKENKKYIDKTFLKRKLLISKLFELLDN